MGNITRTCTLVVAGMIAVASLAGLAKAQDNSVVKVGSLTCRIEGGASFIVGSTRQLNCKYESISGDPPEYYDGEIKRFGLDLGVTGETVMGWAVLAPSRGLEDGALAGIYTGAAADASLGLGGGAKVLVGGSDNTISLQPISLQDQTGVNVALTVAQLRLRHLP